MLRSLGQLLRLARAGMVLLRHDVVPPPEVTGELPVPARLGLRLARLVAGRPRRSGGNPIVDALTELGPSYIKLGQFLATRPDIVGRDMAASLMALQDRLPPFAQEEALAEIRAGLGVDGEKLFAGFGPPVAAASIAQVHKATTREAGGPGRAVAVAVKILRPGIEKRFQRDLDAFFLAARLMERWHEPVRRLRPVDAVATLARSVALEMDLRMEAAAISEMAGNTRKDLDFRVPAVDWQRTSRRVLTCEWIDAMTLADVEALAAAGIDLDRLAETIIQSFLRHAIRDGFFHADMHQGNLFADRDGTLIAVDFGIMGRLGFKERRFLAEILYGFITRDYQRVSQVHFEAGYVPGAEDPAVFAQALRSIGEPLMDRQAEDISMARLLSQLFQITERFKMRTQPQLLLLQKTMVVVEGVARTLNPRLNMWVTAEPVVRGWIEEKLGPQGRIEEAAEGALAIGRLASALPEVLAEAQRTAHMLAQMADTGGIRLDQTTTEALAAAQGRQGRAGQLALWTGALALVAIAVALIW
jgi:ubiquinone biosynthesis protein